MNLSEICQKLPPAGHLFLWAGFFLWEAYLGKTRFGSSIGLIFPILRVNKTKPETGENK